MKRSFKRFFENHHSGFQGKPTILRDIIQTKLGPRDEAIEAMVRDEEG
ncbi:hypothetical protein [Methanofollis sp. UBA420]|jgi:hypothetical protein